GAEGLGEGGGAGVGSTGIRERAIAAKAAATATVPVKTRGAALGGVAAQRALEQRERPLVEDGAPHCRGATTFVAATPLSQAARQRQVLQRQVPRRADVQHA